MAFDGAANVRGRVFGVTAAIGRQGHLRHRLPRQRVVKKQRQNGVVIRGRGQLDLAPRGQLAMKRDHAGHQLALLVQKPLLLFLGVVPPLVLELGQLGVFLEEQGMNPRQVGPDLKVAQVARPKPVRAPAWPSCSRTTASCKVRGSGDAAGSSYPGWP